MRGRQFWRFNAVGIMGAVLQLAMLRLFTGGLGMQYVAATLVAVEVALLHNFVWHEQWTWKGLFGAGWPGRLLRFQLGNGVTSLVSNSVLTVLFHGFLGMPVVVGNLAAIVTTSLLNFGVARYWVFAR